MLFNRRTRPPVRAGP